MVRRFPGGGSGGFRKERLIRVLGVLALLGLALGLSSCSLVDAVDQPQSTLIQKGEPNERIWFVYNFLWIGAAVVFILVEGLLLYALFRYRRPPNTVHGRPMPVHGNTKLEVTWTVIPAIVLVFIAVPTLQIIADLAEPPDEEDALRVDVIAHQFFFEFVYPELDITTSNTMTIPEDTVIDINLFSEDVIHSFWAPKLAGKTDNIPGRINTMWLTAEEPGVYEGQCAEFCGVGHALMVFDVEALSVDDFASWVDEQKNPETVLGDPVIGQELVLTGTCAGCHAIEGTEARGELGPPLTGFATREEIAGVLENTPENLAIWLDNPPAVKPGTGMPDVPLTQQEIAHIVAYLYTLEGE